MFPEMKAGVTSYLGEEDGVREGVDEGIFDSSKLGSSSCSLRPSSRVETADKISHEKQKRFTRIELNGERPLHVLSRILGQLSVEEGREEVSGGRVCPHRPSRVVTTEEAPLRVQT